MSARASQQGNLWQDASFDVKGRSHASVYHLSFGKGSLLSLLARFKQRSRSEHEVYLKLKLVGFVTKLIFSQPTERILPAIGELNRLRARGQIPYREQLRLCCYLAAMAAMLLYHPRMLQHPGCAGYPTAQTWGSHIAQSWLYMLDARAASQLYQYPSTSHKCSCLLAICLLSPHIEELSQRTGAASKSMSF